MKKILIALILTLSFVSTMCVEAADSTYIKNRMWIRQQNAINGVLLCFQRGVEPKKYEDYLFEIASAEVYLMIYNVSPQHYNLVGKLAGTIKSTADYPVFAYRLLKFQFRKKGGTDPNPQNTFMGQHFLVLPRNSQYDKPQKIDF